ncbi:MAG: helix-turn-helix domain-containing protein [Candidatus Aenigmatarchaeota archaeon]
MKLDVLKDIGLTDGEIKVYTALLGLGETTTGPIVDNSGVSVSKVYNILNRLAMKGLVSHIVKGKTKHFRAADPERIIDFFEEKEIRMKEEKNELLKIIPLLGSKKNSILTAETAQVYDGMRGIQTARERSLKIMKKGDEMWIVGIAKTPYDRLLGYFKDFHKRRIKKGVRCHYIYNDYARELGAMSKKYHLSEVRYMPRGIVTHAWIEVYADTVTIGMNYGKSFSIVIVNREVAESFKNYAKLLWGISRA